MTVIAFPDRQERRRRRTRPHRVVIFGARSPWGSWHTTHQVYVTPAGRRALLRCLLFEESGRTCPYDVGSRTAARLIRDGLVMKIDDPLRLTAGLCLTPLGRHALRLIDNPSMPQPQPPGDAA